ncbi:alpha/beta hydrolase [Microbacterium sp. XT11]|uniref:alpha/beta hydrolase n=1 Tax=Microbacterium sp. XT11 TaxID=367477 RepID=UPI0007431140|nr:alpha/beta hydrolase [Microbacterium sp. XT11]ALX67346.1 hypothetical protein AB663_003249 [Microbacterium sp. XT11]
MMGSAESWHRVVPSLVARGYRVLAIDLPGHGLSPRDPWLTVDGAAASVVETVRRVAPDADIHAIGHSFGATVLAAAAPALEPQLAVYVDAGFAIAGGHERDTLIAQYQRDREQRSSAARLRELRPFYSASDAAAEARAAQRFDPETAASVSCGPDQAWSIAPGSILVRAAPSRWVSDDDAAALAARGVAVRSIDGAEHSVWYSHFDEFTASVPEMFGPEPQGG